MAKKSWAELLVQHALLLIIWRIRILQPTAIENYVCEEHERQTNTLLMVDLRNSVPCDVLETCRMVLNRLSTL
jgi:hypothetical protein